LLTCLLKELCNANYLLIRNKYITFIILYLVQISMHFGTIMIVNKMGSIKLIFLDPSVGLAAKKYKFGKLSSNYAAFIPLKLKKQD